MKTSKASRFSDNPFENKSFDADSDKGGGYHNEGDQIVEDLNETMKSGKSIKSAKSGKSSKSTKSKKGKKKRSTARSASKMKESSIIHGGADATENNHNELDDEEEVQFARDVMGFSAFGKYSKRTK